MHFVVDAAVVAASIMSSTNRTKSGVSIEEDV